LRLRRKAHGTEPKRSPNFDRRTNKEYPRYSFNTKTFSEVIPLAEMFYTWNEETKRFHKKLPKNIVGRPHGAAQPPREGGCSP
jgi:hypothetical protein